MPTSTVFSLITLDLSCPLWAYNLDEASTSGNTNQPNRLTYHRIAHLARFDEVGG